MNDAHLQPGLEGGIYSYREAGVLLGVSHQRVRRWADGYTFATKRGFKKSGPVLQTKREHKVLSFVELVELMYVREFLQLAVPLTHVRQTSEVLAQKLQCAYPFATAQLFVDGGKLLASNELKDLIQPDIGQIVMFSVNQIRPRVKFDEDSGYAYLFRPLGHERVVLDARIRTGEPTVSERHVPTRSIYRLWQAEGSLETVKSYFDLDLVDIQAAIAFESEVKFAS
jgi:uncharacterized protein (DUF433 family)